MAIDFLLTDETDYLLCKVTGSYGDNSRKSIDFFPELLARCRSLSFPRVLVDMQDTVGYPSATERILFFEEVISKYEVYLSFGGAPLKMVFLIRPDYMSNYNPGLHVAEQRKFPAKIETELQKALGWLRQPSEVLS